MLLSLDGTLVVQILNFVAFWVLLNYFFIAPTRRAIEARLRHIAEQHREGDELAARAKQLRAQADETLGQARRKTEEIIRAAATQAADETKATENEALEEANAIVQLAHATVATERAQAVATQGPFVNELARSMVDKALNSERAA